MLGGLVKFIDATTTFSIRFEWEVSTERNLPRIIFTTAQNYSDSPNKRK